MTVSTREELAEEVFEVSEFSRFATVDSSTDGLPSTECDCIDHAEDDATTIREGSLITCILQRKEPPEYYHSDNPIWVVEYAACYDCQIASLYERVDKSNPVAVAEGAVVPGDNCLVFEPRYVWDLHIPSEETPEV